MHQPPNVHKSGSQELCTSDSRRSSVARKLPSLRLATPLLCVLLAGTPLAHAQDQKQQVLQAVTALFDAMRAKDADALDSAFLPEGRLGTKGTQAWIAQVASSDAYLDEVTFDETVLVDDKMAMAWTPYNLFVNGEFHHCGVDVFSLRKSEGQWKILQLDDTRRTEGCDPKRRGR
ncbi:nuclear transport factor 2 family protein [Congregibacter variabilis]|uniref:Nuclear transport factor 2 family protein n=1 Tax=Congregibacter variabilis TaxID=3081200 RepID=A0ABZ0I5C5_9GAMM|nr:nuclear transport factor 2 family protein [Congregibacter sp. IMCC43200]